MTCGTSWARVGGKLRERGRSGASPGSGAKPESREFRPESQALNPRPFSAQPRLNFGRTRPIRTHAGPTLADVGRSETPNLGADLTRLRPISTATPSSGRTQPEVAKKSTNFWRLRPAFGTSLACFWTGPGRILSPYWVLRWDCAGAALIRQCYGTRTALYFAMLY